MAGSVPPTRRLAIWHLPNGIPFLLIHAPLWLAFRKKPHGRVDSVDPASTIEQSRRI